MGKLMHEAQCLENAGKPGYVLCLRKGGRLQAHGESGCSCTVGLLLGPHIRSLRGYALVPFWLRTELVLRLSDLGGGGGVLSQMELLSYVQVSGKNWLS